MRARAPAAGSDVVRFSAPRLRHARCRLRLQVLTWAVLVGCNLLVVWEADADLVKSPSVVVLPDPDAENRNSDEAVRSLSVSSHSLIVALSGWRRVCPHTVRAPCAVGSSVDSGAAQT